MSRTAYLGILVVFLGSGSVLANPTLSEDDASIVSRCGHHKALSATAQPTDSADSLLWSTLSMICAPLDLAKKGAFFLLLSPRVLLWLPIVTSITKAEAGQHNFLSPAGLYFSQKRPPLSKANASITTMPTTTPTPITTHPPILWDRQTCPGKTLSSHEAQQHERQFLPCFEAACSAYSTLAVWNLAKKGSRCDTTQWFPQCDHTLCDAGILPAHRDAVKATVKHCQEEACQNIGFTDLGWRCHTKRHHDRNHIYVRTKKLNACAQKICEQHAGSADTKSWRFLQHLKDQSQLYTLCPGKYVSSDNLATVKSTLTECHHKAGCLPQLGLFIERRLTKLLSP